MIEQIYDTTGEHIANFINGRLYNHAGKDFAVFRLTEGIFIDLEGHYIGEMFQGRIAHNKNSIYRKMNYGRQGDMGNMGRLTKMVNQIGVMLPFGWEPFDRSHLEV